MAIVFQCECGRPLRANPETAGKKLYGELVMMVTVNFDGRLLVARCLVRCVSRERKREREPSTLTIVL